MSPGAFDPLIYGLGIALPVAAAGTPLAWRAARPLPRAARVAGTSLACLGLSGLASLPFSLGSEHLEPTTITAVVLSAILQGLALPVLLLLSRKA